MQPKSPRRCVIELGYQCNLSCITCNIWKKEFPVHRHLVTLLSKEDIFAIVTHLAAAGMQQITYVGGEPLLNSEINKIIQHTHDQGMKAAIVTNGTMLSPQRSRQLIDAGLHTLIVSLDGPASTHDLIRGAPGTFSKVYENILYLSHFKKKRGLKLPKLNIYTTISQVNRFSIPSLLSITQRLDVNSLRFQLISVVNREISDQTNHTFSKDVVGYHSYAVCQDLKPPPDEVEKIRHTLIKSIPRMKQIGIKIQLEAILSAEPPMQGCSFIKNSMVINPAGDIIICPMLTNLTIGNLKHQSLSQLWGNTRHQAFLKLFEEKNRLPICQECCVEKLAPV